MLSVVKGLAGCPTLSVAHLIRDLVMCLLPELSVLVVPTEGDQ